MATRTGSSAYLTVVNAIAQGNHRSGRSFGHGKVPGCSRTCACIRSLRRLGGSLHHLTRRSRRTRAWSDRRGAAPGTALIHDAIDPATDIVGNVERPIRSDREAGRTMCGAVWSLYRPRETVGENLAVARCAVAEEGLKNYVIAALRVWRTIP